MRLRQAAIIGAGPAGSAAATLLARAGVRTILIESRAFPRTKVCGEFLGPAAVNALANLIGPGALAAAGAVQIDCLALECGDRTLEWRLPAPGWSLSRETLDSLLLEAARAAGARVVQPVAARLVHLLDDGVDVQLADGSAIEADVAIHADGTGRGDPGGPVPRDTRLIGHKCHLRIPGGVEGVRMRCAPGAYVGTIQVDGGRATCAIAARRALVGEGGPDCMLSRLWPAYDPAWREGEWLSCPIPRSRFIGPGHPRSLRIGNAGAAVDPVGGEGIGLALWSGRECASLLLADAAGAAKRLAQAYRSRLRWRLPACRMAAEILMRPAVVRALWPALRIRAATIAPWYALKGYPA